MSPATPQTLSRNKMAAQKYQKIECFEAGIKLLGSEVKSVKANQASINGAYAVVRGGEVFMVSTTIPAWQPKNQSSNYDPERARKLLLTSKQLSKLSEYDNKKGFALIVFALYNKKGLIKAELCVAQNKSTRDRRQEIRRRDQERDLNRSLKI
jgi:SsrA-binding protein